MPNLLALSFEGPVAPSFDLRCLAGEHGRPDGWGLAYYPGSEPSASVLKEPAPPPGSIRSELVKAWEHLEASLFVLHIRHARWGANTDANTQPFVRTYGGRDWLCGHAGSLDRPPALAPNARFEPVGATDTERLFCVLLERFAERGWRSIADADLELVRAWFLELNDGGSLSFVLSDGLDLLAYADKHSDGYLALASFAPPYQRAVFADDDVAIDLTRRGAKPRRGVLVTSSPLENEGDALLVHRRVAPGHLVVVREGYVRHRSQAELPEADRSVRDSIPVWPVAQPIPSRTDLELAHRYRVTHRTVYRYERPVERSVHLFRLSPIIDRLQHVERHSLTLSVAGETYDFDDAFGNRCRRVTFDRPWKELVVEAESVVRVEDDRAWRTRPKHLRTTVPHVWLPWQSLALQPFLPPTELHETELLELREYADGFVRRSGGDLVETLVAINATLFKEYAYVPGSTTLATTPFDVYANRRGVCQDFANLFVCLARLLGVPARYACGYVWVPPQDDRAPMAQASHAWAEVYLPDIGWKGFDPTNGTQVRTEHIRVATGRHYRDTAPTAGTLFLGGGRETLEVSVHTTRIADEDDP
jgi:transglutaminase-like putative cysteine protease/predicted glutamine amidotransferase